MKDNPLAYLVPIVAQRETFRTQAVYIGHSTFKESPGYFGRESNQRWAFWDCEHYFNANFNEIGMAAWIGSRVESVISFDPPRIWADEYKRNLHLTKCPKAA
jgi:hypothetical protein